jgi:hypothetical protein
MPRAEDLMNSNKDRQQHQESVRRAVELGRLANPDGLPELSRLLKMPSPEIRRLAASAMAKLAGFGADRTAAVAALKPVALGDPHPQVRQYALKALKGYGSAAKSCLAELDDMSSNGSVKDYIRLAASSAATAIREAVRGEESQSVRACSKCASPVAPDEYDRSMKAFQRIYCDICFDTVFLQRRNWETQVEMNKTIQAADGTVVQSDGERAIAEELTRLGIVYRYDNRFRIIKGYAIRPDFYLPEFDLYIEYWGMEDNLDYQIGMLEKKKLYQQAGKKLVSLYSREKYRLSQVLREKLSLHVRLPSASVSESGAIPAKEP